MIRTRTSYYGINKVFSDNLVSYIRRESIDRKTLADRAGLPYTSISDWISRKTYSRIAKIEVLANFFSIRKSDLIEYKRTDFDIIEPYRGLNKDNRLKVYGYAIALQGEQIARQIKEG